MSDAVKLDPYAHVVSVNEYMAVPIKANMHPCLMSKYVSRQGARLIFTKTSRLGLRPTQPHPKLYRRCFLKVKWPGRDADHSHPSSAEVKNTLSYTSTATWQYAVDSDTFTSTLVSREKMSMAPKVAIGDRTPLCTRDIPSRPK